MLRSRSVVWVTKPIHGSETTDLAQSALDTHVSTFKLKKYIFHFQTPAPREVGFSLRTRNNRHFGKARVFTKQTQFQKTNQCTKSRMFHVGIEKRTPKNSGTTSFRRALQQTGVVPSGVAHSGVVAMGTRSNSHYYKYKFYLHACAMSAPSYTSLVNLEDD